MNYRIEKLNPSNLKDLIILYRDVFKRHFTEETLRKKYDTSYLGKSYFGHIAYDEQDYPAAFHGAIPFRLQYKDSIELAAQYGDAMTNPKHAGKGLFTRLGRLTDNELKGAGIRFVYGFPNQNSEYGYLNKLDWISNERMQRFKIDVSTIPVAKLFKLIPAWSDTYKKFSVSQFKPYLSEVKELPNSATDGNHGGSVRDKRFFKYKSFTDNAIYNFNDVLFWLKIERTISIGDIEVCKEEKILAAITELRKLAALLGIPTITVQSSPGSFLDKLFSKYYTPISSWAIGYKNFNSAIPLQKLRFTYGDLDTF